MTQVLEPATIDPVKLERFVLKAVDEVGATLNTALVVMGDKLGLYRGLAGAGPLSPSELAARTAVAERYVGEWLNAQAAGGYVLCTPSSLSQEVGLALGAQAGEARIRDVVTAAGFTRFRRAAETPFNIVYEARP